MNNRLFIKLFGAMKLKAANVAVIRYVPQAVPFEAIYIDTMNGAVWSAVCHFIGGSLKLPSGFRDPDKLVGNHVAKFHNGLIAVYTPQQMRDLFKLECGD